MDPIRVAADFEAVGLRLLDEVKIVKDKSVRSECMKCGVVVNYSYSQVKLRIKRGTGLTGCRACFKALYWFMGFLRLVLFLIKPYSSLVFKLFVLYLGFWLAAAACLLTAR